MKEWYGTSHCDFCGKLMDIVIDGKTVFGPWAAMCETCSEKHGIGLGTGIGQKYVLKEGRYIKVEG
jgi:hypothetical protein